MSGGVYKNKWCTVTLQCNQPGTDFRQKYYRIVKTHDQETSFKTAAVAAAGGITGYMAAIDYTMSTQHVSSEPTSGIEI